MANQTPGEGGPISEDPVKDRTGGDDQINGGKMTASTRKEGGFGTSKALSLVLFAATAVGVGVLTFGDSEKAERIQEERVKSNLDDYQKNPSCVSAKSEIDRFINDIDGTKSSEVAIAIGVQTRVSSVITHCYPTNVAPLGAGSIVDPRQTSVYEKDITDYVTQVGKKVDQKLCNMNPKLPYCNTNRN